MYSLHSFTKQESYLKYYQNMVSANFDDVSGLKISQKETELNTMLSYLNESAPQVVTLRAEIKALNAQLEKEKNKVTSDLPQDKLNNVALEFQNLALEFGFAEDVYKAALKAVETTRIEMSRKVKQLVVIQSPRVPEAREYPKKGYNIFTIFIVLTLLYRLSGLIRMIVSESRY